MSAFQILLSDVHPVPSVRRSLRITGQLMKMILFGWTRSRSMAEFITQPAGKNIVKAPELLHLVPQTLFSANEKLRLAPLRLGKRCVLTDLQRALHTVAEHEHGRHFDNSFDA